MLRCLALGLRERMQRKKHRIMGVGGTGSLGGIWNCMVAGRPTSKELEGGKGGPANAILSPPIHTHP